MLIGFMFSSFGELFCYVSLPKITLAACELLAHMKYSNRILFVVTKILDSSITSKF